MSKKIVTGFLVVAMVVSSISLSSMKTEAAYAYEDNIQYIQEGYNIKDYWNEDSAKRIAPVKEGYVFGGWYADDNGEQPLTEETAKTATEAFAKFVPAYVLSVKAQIDADTKEAKDGKDASMRVISSIDSRNYKKVGFDILLANRIPIYQTNEAGEKQPLETEKIYTGLKVGDSEPYAPSAIFGTMSEFLSVWRLDGIKDVNDAKIINVTPYWITLDGTKVEGLGKYVHVEDGYLGYVSVPINFKTTNQIAAGTLQMTYPFSDLEVVDVEFNNVDGSLLPKTEIEYNDNQAGIIKFVGNAANVNESMATDGIYANIRFRVKDTSTYRGAGLGTFLNFEVTKEQFCDWKESAVIVDAWDIQY